MRLDGLSIRQIAAECHCSTDQVGNILKLWQKQVALCEGLNFKPKCYNRRRWKQRGPATPCKQGNPMKARRLASPAIPRGIIPPAAVAVLQLAA